MSSLSQINQFIHSLIKRSFLPEEYFKVENELIEDAVATFTYDYSRWYSGDIDINRLYTTPQLIAMLCYRISRAAHCNNHYINVLPPPDESTPICDINAPNKYAADAYSILGRQIGQIEIYYSAEIGKGLKINHGVGTVIGARCRIGDNCMIHQNCTIGDRKGGRPQIGNNVIIYAGSMILGDITIGDNTIIGANSVVTKSCPSNSVLAGTPAKIIGSI